jgi:predicted Zn-ribbon and HTH transcriptional regulator
MKQKKLLPLDPTIVKAAMAKIQSRNLEYLQRRIIEEEYALVMESGVCPLCGSTRIKEEPSYCPMSRSVYYECRKCKLKVSTHD